MIALELVVWMLCFLYLYIMEILDFILFYFLMCPFQPNVVSCFYMFML